MGESKERADEIWTVQQVADYLQLSVRQVQRLGIPFLDCGKRNRRYPRSCLYAWQDARRTTQSKATL